MTIEREISAIIQRLIEARKAAGLTQTEAALQVGLSRASSICQYETRQRGSIPNLTLFLKLCAVYGVDPVWVLTGINPDLNTQEIQKRLRTATKHISLGNALLHNIIKPPIG